MRAIGAVAAAGLIGVGVALARTKTGCKFPSLRIPRSWRRLYNRKLSLPAVSAAHLGAPQSGLALLPIEYPKVRRDPAVVDKLHGVNVEDPYRWLEDPVAEDTKAFVDAQNTIAEKVLSQCETRDKFKAMLTQVFDYSKFSTPFKRGGRYYYHHNTGLQQHYVLYSQASLTDDSPKVVIDPNTLSEDGTVALGSMAFTHDGSTLAYTLSSGGSDWVTIHTLSLDAEGEVTHLPDKLDFAKFTSLDWTHDHKGFFYNRYPDPGKSELGTETDSATNQQLCYHVLGTPQSSDPVIYTVPEHPKWTVGAEVSDDGKYLLLSLCDGCLPANQLYVIELSSLPRTADGTLDFSAHDLSKGGTLLPTTKLVTDFAASYSYLANDGSMFYFKTSLNAPGYRIVKVDLSKPGPAESWEEVVAQHPRDLMKSAIALKGDNLVIKYLRDVKSVLQLHSLSTGVLKQELELPGVGSVGGFSGRREDSEFFFSFVGFTEPGASYRVDIQDAEIKPQLFRRTELKVDHNPDDYVTRQVFVTSKDGTKVPMFVSHRKGIQLDGNNPTLLYGYGGFNISLEPSFSASRLCWMRCYNGVFAQANLRGGGEYGVEWRNAGSKENKQNVFDDFQACAEFLTAEGYSSPARLAIQGGSNGGLLVAACANQRPDLYAAVLGQVGVMDMLRFHKFTIGHAWCTDYGCADNEEDFQYLIRYSPLHNIRVPLGGTKQYPAVLLTTGDHDDRVVPLHSLKLIATLQHELAGSEDAAQRNPLIVHVELKAGHGAGKPTDKVLQESADLHAFAAKCLKAEWKA